MSATNIEKLKYQFQLQLQVKELLQKNFIDLKDPFHFEVIVGILDKAKQQRNLSDLELLSMAFSSIKFFSEMSKTTSDEELRNLYKELTYMEIWGYWEELLHYPEGICLGMMYGHHYQVLIPRPGQNEGALSHKQHNDKKKHAVQQNPNNIPDEGTIEDEYEFKELNDEDLLAAKYPNMMKVGLIETEGSFGEIALTNFIPRQASIVCREHTHFIKLSREAFNKFLSEYYNRLQERNFQFLQSVKMFQNWPAAELNQIHYHMQPLEFYMNRLIYKEGEIVKGVYFIKEGYIELSESLSANKGRGHYFIRQQTTNWHLKLHRLGPGQAFGYNEIVKGIETRNSKALCISEKTSLLFLDAERFQMYCCQGEMLDELIMKVQQETAIKEKSSQIILEKQQIIPRPNKYNSISISEESIAKLTDQSIQQQSSNNSRIVKRNNVGSSNPLGAISDFVHQPTQIQHLKELLSSKARQSHKGTPKNPILTFESPLIEILPSRKSIAASKINSKSMDSNSHYDPRAFLIQKLKLPKIFKNQQQEKQEDCQLVVMRFVHNDKIA